MNEFAAPAARERDWHQPPAAAAAAAARLMTRTFTASSLSLSLPINSFYLSLFSPFG